MAFTFDTSFVNHYTSNVHMNLAEKSKLMGLFDDEPSKNGEVHFFETYTSIAGVDQLIERGAGVVPEDAIHGRRMAEVLTYNKAMFVYDMDKMRSLIDPTSIYVQDMARAHAVNFDRVCLSALLGTARYGKAGASSASFDTSGHQIAHGSAGLTVAKLNQAIRILEEGYVDVGSEDLYLIINGRGVEDLMAETQVVSFDYMNEKPLAGKSLPMFRGLHVVRSESLPAYTAGSVYRAVVTTRRALKVAKWNPFSASIDKRADIQNQPMQIYTESAFGAVRMEEGLVVDILFQ